VPLNSHEFNKFMHGIIKEHKENLYRTKVRLRARARVRVRVRVRVS
jgi:hypothetical protein